MLKAELPTALDEQIPGLFLFNAGTDIYLRDPPGGLSITTHGILLRDENVFRECIDRAIPVAMVLSGGYHKGSARIIGESVENLLRTVLKMEGGSE